MAYPQHLDATERKIIDKIIVKSLQVGWKISVHDGEEWAITGSTDHDKITAEIAATDETTLVLRQADSKIVGRIWLVHGNGEDVVSDCSDNDDINALVALAQNPNWRP